MYEEKLSIIIPTRNRQYYAYRCVKTLLNKLSGDFEIVIHDNSDDNSLKNMLSDVLDDLRLKYSYESTTLSFCENFERSILMSTGDYLIMIGDDDCVLPEIMDLVTEVRRKGIDSVLFPTCYTYYWPNSLKDNEGKLVIRKQNAFVKILSTKDAIGSMKTVGNYDYQHYNFPKIYHGIVKREKFDMVKNRTGHYFGGLTPDIYSAVALSFHIDRILYVNVPYTLPGICAKSGSADSLTGRHTGELSEAPHFRGHIDYHWDEDIPYIYSVDTIWAETAFKAIKECGETISLTDEEWFRFMIYIIRKSPVFKDRLAKMYAEKTKQSEDSILMRIEREIKKLDRRYWAKKIFSFAKQVCIGRYVHSGVEDIETAIDIIQRRKQNYENVQDMIRKADW